MLLWCELNGPLYNTHHCVCLLLLILNVFPADVPCSNSMLQTFKYCAAFSSDEDLAYLATTPANNSAESLLACLHLSFVDSWV